MGYRKQALGAAWSEMVQAKGTETEECLGVSNPVLTPIPG